MARPLRVQRTDAWYHVCARGAGRKPIFNDDRDRRHWLELIPEWVNRFGLQVFAYAMMENHYHLVMAAPALNLSQAMQWFQTSYSMWFNRKHGRVGPLFQGRYGAVVVEPQTCGLELSRYVHLNPVRLASFSLDKDSRRAGRIGIEGKVPAEVLRRRVERLREFRWSSYRAYVGRDRAPQWLERKPILDACARGAVAEQRRTYQKYVEEAIPEGMEEGFLQKMLGQVAMGSQEWMNRIIKGVKGNSREQPQTKNLRPRPELKKVIAAVEKVRGLPWAEFCRKRGDWGRDLVWYVGWHECSLTLAKLGQRAGGADYAAVSAAIKSMERKMEKNRTLQLHAKQIREMMLF